MKKLKKDIKERAEESTRIVKKSGGNEKTIKEGKPLDHSLKHSLKSSEKIVGVSFGFTINMGDYESLRVDCWASDEVQEGESQVQAFDRLSKVVRNQVQKEVNLFLEQSQ